MLQKIITLPYLNSPLRHSIERRTASLAVALRFFGVLVVSFGIVAARYAARGGRLAFGGSPARRAGVRGGRAGRLGRRFVLSGLRAAGGLVG